MSEIDADLDRAAAAYWLSVAGKSTPEKNVALARAASLLRDARAEARISDSARQPTLSDLEAPPLDVAHRRWLTP
ncbi:hypothetical protein [Acidocella facilis]|uniref:hypothetical protein n=1 Tax=Acidocella facilis TaxID=525 RepID=UPI001F400DA2|nr:hypothetical protein [Acidocella facilis]